MRKIIILGFFCLILFISVNSEQKIAQFEKEVKAIKNSVAPSLVKVIAENHKRYVATGIAIADDMILTSTLITTRAYDKIYVKTINGKQYNADIMGRDSKHAIILLKLKEKVMTPIRRSYELEVGDWIALVGVFYNKFPSIFQGIVSSLTEKEMILNAPVFPGASGGAVVNKKGELVAVIRGRLRIAVEPDISIIDHKGELILHSPKLKNKNLCYAVPIKKVMEIANQIKEYGHVKRGWLGIYIRSDKTGREAKITYVVKGSPAESAGLRKYDIVISINGNKIKKYSDVSRIIHSIHPGKKVKINVLRNQVPKTIRVQIGEVQPKKYYEFGNFRITLPRSPMIIPEFDGTFPQAKNFTLYRKGSKKLGVDVIEITTGLAKKFKIKEGYGLMISKVYEKSSAEKAGFSEGDIIIQANKKPLKTFTDIRNTLNELNEKEPIKLVFYRDGKRRSMNMIPDIINDEFVDWNDFLSRSDIFSRYFGDSYRMRLTNILKRQSEMLKAKLERLKEAKKNISEDKLERIKKEIVLLKEKLEATYNKELKRIQEGKRRINEENRKFKEEERRIKKEIEKIKSKIKEDKKPATTSV